MFYGAYFNPVQALIIPNISSPVKFFDVVYLGIFITLSHAFNPLFHDLTVTLQALVVF